MERVIEFVTLWVTQRPRTVMALVLLISIVAAVGYTDPPAPWKRTQQGDRFRTIEGENQLLEEVKDSFGIDPPHAYLVIESDELFTRDTINAIRDVVDALEQLAYVSDVFWIEEIPILNVFGLAESVLPARDAEPSGYGASRQAALDHPLIGGQLVSADGTLALLPITFDWLEVTSDDDVSDRLLRVARETPDADQIAIRLTGDVPLYLAQLNSNRRNQRKFQIIGYGLIFITSAILFRGLFPVLIVGSAPVLGIFWTFGLMGWFDTEANPLTDSVLPVLLALLGVTDGVHMMVHLRKGRAGGASPKSAVRNSLREVGSACILTSLTTAVGFASLSFAQSDFVQGFGKWCAFGVLVTLVAVLVVIPLLSLSPLGRNLHQGMQRDMVVGPVGRLSRVIDWILKHRRLVSIAGILITLAFAAISLQLQPNSRLGDALPSRSETYQALADVDERLGGIEFVRVVVRWPESMDWDDPRILAAVEDAEAVVEEEPLLAGPISVVGVLRTFPGDDSQRSHRLGLVDLMPNELRQGFFDFESRRALITVRAQDLGVGRYEQVFRGIESELTELAARHPEFTFDLTGDMVVRSREIYQIVEDLAVSLGVASVIIFAMLTLAFRSLRIGLITLIPNILPLVSTASLLVLTNRKLDVSAVCAFTVCLGIAVDDTIHFLNRFVRLRDAGRPINEAIREGFLQVGAALIMTTIVLLAGFSTVLTSELQTQRTFAAMACSTIAAALLADMIILPALLSWVGPKKKAASPGPAAEPAEDSTRPVVP